jgi:hypothetical protein
MEPFSHLLPYVDNFDRAKSKLVHEWMSCSDVVNVLRKYEIATNFYGKYFAVKIINYALGVIRGTNALGNCPVVGVMLVFFEKKNIELEEIFTICVNLKNTLIQFMLKEKILNPDTLREISLLIDHNFVGVIRDYIHLHYSINEDHSSCSIALNDTKNINSCTIYQVNTAINTTSALHYMQEVEMDLGLIDELGEIEIETICSIDVTDKMDDTSYREVILLLNNYIKVIKHLVEFQELTYTLTLLVNLLETTPVESISVDNCGVVSIYIKAIIDDLSMWRRSVFVDQSAEDIHYLDKTLLSSIAQLQITLSQGEGAMTDEIEFF